jgi:hypothetical protein
VQLANSRPLSDPEKKIIDLLLSPEFPGVPELRMQIDDALVIGKCDCGCPTIDIKVAETAARSLPQSGSGPLPYEGSISSGEHEPSGGIILFSSDGYISGLEYYSFTDAPPPDWPDFDRIELVGPFR